MLKILYCYLYGILGGVSTQLLNRLKFLNTCDNVQVSILYTKDFGISKTLENLVNVYFEEDPSAVISLAENLEIDVVIVIDSPKYFEVLTKAKNQGQLKDTAIVSEVHTTTEKGVAYLEHHEDYSVDGYIVPSSYMKEMLHSRFGIGNCNEGPKLPIEIVSNSVCTDLFCQKKVTNFPDTPIILWVGKIDDHKNWPALLEITSKVKESLSDFQLWMIGGETAPKKSWQTLLESVEDYGLMPWFRWFPRVENHAMPYLYSMVSRSGGLSLITSINESFGMSALESLLCGCPVVASRVGALPEIAPGKNYFKTYELGDNDEAVRCLKEILVSDSGKNSRDELNRDFSQLNEIYSPEIVGVKYLKALELLLDREICDSNMSVYHNQSL